MDKIVICKKCKKKIKLTEEQTEESGMLNWKCPHCYTIQPFCGVFKIKWNCKKW